MGSVGVIKHRESAIAARIWRDDVHQKKCVRVRRERIIPLERVHWSIAELDFLIGIWAAGTLVSKQSRLRC